MVVGVALAAVGGGLGAQAVHGGNAARRALWVRAQDEAQRPVPLAARRQRLHLLLLAGIQAAQVGARIQPAGVQPTTLTSHPYMQRAT